MKLMKLRRLPQALASMAGLPSKSLQVLTTRPSQTRPQDLVIFAMGQKHFHSSGKIMKGILGLTPWQKLMP
jgi:hypothetical protein